VSKLAIAKASVCLSWSLKIMAKILIVFAAKGPDIEEERMKRRAVDPVRGLLLIALLLAGMGLATLWRHWDRLSLIDSSGAVFQIVAAVMLLTGLAGAFLAPALSRRRLGRQNDWCERRPSENSVPAMPIGEGPVIEGEVLAPEPEPRAGRANRG
jgi:hypothetical protein